MRLLAFSGRTAKEILRDPLNLFFGLGFPLVLIGLLTAIQSNIPVPIFELAHLTPGVTIFGLSFYNFVCCCSHFKGQRKVHCCKGSILPRLLRQISFWLHPPAFTNGGSAGESFAILPRPCLVWN